MRSYLKLYLMCIKIAISVRIAYRGDYLISMLVVVLLEMILPVITIIIYSSGLSYPGWNLYELMLMQGIFILSRSISFIFFMGLSNVVFRGIKDGYYDLYLIKPRSTLF